MPRRVVLPLHRTLHVTNREKTAFGQEVASWESYAQLAMTWNSAPISAVLRFGISEDNTL